METWQIITAGLLIAAGAWCVAVYFLLKHGGMPEIEDVEN